VTPTTKPRTSQIVAAVIGNALEWYDFVVYGFLTVIIARLFFPAQNEYASLLLTMATFGVGFFMRPVGGIVIGLYADRKGRKAALQLIIGLMTLAMAMIAFAPPYAAIGIAAPLLMLLARLLQGFATGGEFASATTFLVESAPSHRRGFYGSLQMVGQSLAALCGAVAGTLITRGLAPEQIDAWGWRLPFLFGLIIGPVGLYIRSYLHETDAFLESRRAGAVRNPLRTVLAQNGRGLAVTFGLVICGTGIDMNFAERGELRHVAGNIATWADRYQPPPDECSPRLGRFPYLADDYALIERSAGATPWIADIHVFAIASTMSFGASGSSINAMTTAVPKLVHGLTRGLFRADIERHWASFKAYDVPQAVVARQMPATGEKR